MTSCRNESQTIFSLVASFIVKTDHAVYKKCQKTIRWNSQSYPFRRNNDELAQLAARNAPPFEIKEKRERERERERETREKTGSILQK